jgi:hypothetical protein
MEVLEASMTFEPLVAAVERMADVERMAAVKTAMGPPVPTTSGQRGYGHRCHCQDRNC